jgi:hypothetical protein
MLNATADRANGIASPTVIFAGILVVGFGLDMIWPASFLPEGWGFPLGLIVIFAAVNIKLFAVREMVRVKTNLDIRKPANDLATSGKLILNRNLATNICATKPRSGAGSKITFRLADFTLAGVEPVYNPQDY